MVNAEDNNGETAYFYVCLNHCFNDQGTIIDIGLTVANSLIDC